MLIRIYAIHNEILQIVFLVVIGDEDHKVIVMMIMTKVMPMVERVARYMMTSTV